MTIVLVAWEIGGWGKSTMHRYRLLSSLAVIALAQAGWGLSALAQEAPGRGTTVLERPRPETDPLGIRSDGFLIFPSLTVTQQFRDNIFFDEEDSSTNPNDLQGDFITVLSTTLLFQSDWNNHQLNFFGDADIGSFFINSDENYSDWHLGTNGRYDISRDTNVSARFDIANRHETRGSPDDVNGKHPIFYNLFGPTVGFFHRFNRVSVTLNGNLVKYNFEDVTTGIDGSRGILSQGQINNDDRDRTEVEGSAEVAYEIIPNYDAFLRGIVNDRDYKDFRDDNGFQRDSSGWEVVGGTAIDFTGVLFGNVFAGYRRQSYDDPRFSTTQGVGFGADVTWNLSGLTTIKASSERSVEETTLSGASGFFASRFAASVDHELLRNLILSANGSFQKNKYDGNARKDDIVRAAAQVKYLMNRNFYLTVGYDFQNRESNFINQNYTVNTVMIRIEGQL